MNVSTTLPEKLVISSLSVQVLQLHCLCELLILYTSEIEGWRDVVDAQLSHHCVYT
jgi:hypothetical protein